MADKTLLSEVAALRLQVEGLLGLQSVVEEQRAEIRELRALLDSKGSERSSMPVNLRPPPAEAWNVVASRGRRRPGRREVTSCVSTVPETRNSFSALEDQCSRDNNKEVSAGDSTRPAGKCVVVGDSQVRGLGRLFCARDSERRMCACLPGAGVGDLVERLDGVLRGEGVAPIVCISAGGNDIGTGSSEELLRRYRQALGRVRDLGGTPVLCGILPRKFAGAGWWSEAAAVNSRLADHCRRNGWLFVDNWNYFFGKDYLYNSDGVHLSRRGTGALAWSLQRDLQAWGFLGRV